MTDFEKQRGQRFPYPGHPQSQGKAQRRGRGKGNIAVHPWPPDNAVVRLKWHCCSTNHSSPSSEVPRWINEDQVRTIAVFTWTKLCPSGPLKAILPTAEVLIRKVWNDFHCYKLSLKSSQTQRSAQILCFCFRLTSQYLWEPGECGDAREGQGDPSTALGTEGFSQMPLHQGRLGLDVRKNFFSDLQFLGQRKQQLSQQKKDMGLLE